MEANGKEMSFKQLKETTREATGSANQQINLRLLDKTELQTECIASYKQN